MKTQRGMTLIELMVVVVIIGILAAVAFPSYAAQVRKSRRAAAQSFLMDVAGREQQRLLDVRSYTNDLASLNLAVPQEIVSAYTVTVETQTGPLRFTVTATPIAEQAKDTACNPMTLTNTGAKAPAACW